MCETAMVACCGPRSPHVAVTNSVPQISVITHVPSGTERETDGIATGVTLEAMARHGIIPSAWETYKVLDAAETRVGSSISICIYMSPGHKGKAKRTHTKFSNMVIWLGSASVIVRETFK